MKNNMKRIWAITLAVMMIFSMVPGAMAAEYYSGSLSVGGRVKITAAPTKAPTPAPEATDEPVESVEPVESIEPVESVEPVESIEPTESPEPTESIEPSASPEAPVEETPLPEETETTPEPAYEARQAVVAKSGEVDTAFLREGPSTDYERVGKVRNGMIVTVLGEENGWAFIEVDGMQAWISGSFLSFDLSETVEPEETATPEPTAEPTATPEASAEPTDGLEGEEEVFEPIEGLVVNNDADVRLEGDGLSEILVTITAETPVTVIGIEGDWIKVEVDGVIGYVYIDDIAGIRDIEGLLPETTPAPTVEPGETPAPNFKITIFTTRRSVMMPGETITLTSKLEGFDGYETLLQWECNKGNGYEAIEGANGDSYSYEANAETLSYDWRLTVYYR